MKHARHENLCGRLLRSNVTRKPNKDWPNSEVLRAIGVTASRSAVVGLPPCRGRFPRRGRFCYHGRFTRFCSTKPPRFAQIDSAISIGWPDYSNGSTSGQLAITTNPKARQMKTKKTMVAPIIAGLAMLLPVRVWSQTLAPKFNLKSGPAEEVQAEENYVMQQPVPAAVPFRPIISASAYAAAKEAATANSSPLARRPAAPSAPLPAAPPTTVFANFSAASDVDGFRPPDTHGAAGKTQFVEVTNSHFNVFNKSDHALAKSVTLATFFNYTTKAIFDPRVVYDSTWNRWVVTAEAFPESTTVQYFFIAVSKTSSATKGFFVYKLDVDFSNNNDFWDFPQLGLDQDAVLITANIFNSSNVFQGADFFAIAKARLYNGLGFSVPVFKGLAGTLAPPIVLDQNGNTFLIAAPPSGTTLTKYTVTNSSHPASTALVSSSITVPSYNVPPGAHQVGTTNLLDTSDSRFVNASTQNGDDLWQTHTVGLSGSATPKFYRVNTATNTVSQSSTFFQTSTSDDFNASITANVNGDAFVTWTATDATNSNNAQVIFSGKRSADTSITSPGGVAGIISSTFYDPSSDTTERWGDYSAVTIDPSSISKAWLVNEKINSTSSWGSQIMQVGF